MTCCPKCGQTLPEKPMLNGTHLTPYQKRIFELVARAGPNGIGSDDLFDKLYADDADGGPITGRKSLYVMIKRLKAKLEHHGMQVRKVPNGRRAAWNYVLTRNAP